jgi:phospholipid/cholesterol/gamma-HCH transport system substrate-binding protein
VIRTAVKFGGFVAVCVAFTLWLAFTIGNVELFENRYQLTATFDDVTGLLVNDNVKVAGVVVGKVRTIKVDQGRARVTFDVREDVKLPSDSKAAVRWRNLLGQRYVYLYPGRASTTLQNEDEVARTTSVVDLGKLFNRLGPIVAAIDPKQVNSFLDTVVHALDGNEGKVRQAIDDLSVLAAGLGSRDEAIGRLLENVNTVAATVNDRDQQIRTMLDNLVQISQAFSDNTDVLDSAATELGDFSDALSFLLQNNRTEVDQIVANLKDLGDVVDTKLGVLDHALGGVDDAVIRVFNSSREGEWLNQVIPCVATGPPPEGEPCAQDASGQPAGSSAGVDAVRELMGLTG